VCDRRAASALRPMLGWHSARAVASPGDHFRSRPGAPDPPPTRPPPLRPSSCAVPVLSELGVCAAAAAIGPYDSPAQPQPRAAAPFTPQPPSQPRAGKSAPRSAIIAPSGAAVQVNVSRTFDRDSGLCRRVHRFCMPGWDVYGRCATDGWCTGGAVRFVCIRLESELLRRIRVMRVAYGR
jgi:hypothetical protein